MKKTLYIHIGHPKCGSSTIQTFLIENVSALKVCGYTVLDQALNVFHQGSSQRPPVEFFAMVKRGEKSPEEIMDRLKLAAKTMDETGCRSLLLSAENLSDRSMPAHFKGLKEVYDIKVIYYIRRQDDWLLSAWKQWKLKHGLSLDAYIEQHTKRQQSSFKQVIDVWTDVVGQGNVSVGFLNREMLYEGDLLQDFCKRVGVNFSKMLPVKDANKSYSIHLLRVLAECPFLFEGPHDNDLFSFLDREFGDLVSARGENPLTPDERNKILLAHQGENAWLAKHFFSDEWLEKYINTLPDKPITKRDDFKALAMMQGVILKLLMKEGR